MKDAYPEDKLRRHTASGWWERTRDRGKLEGLISMVWKSTALVAPFRAAISGDRKQF